MATKRALLVKLGAIGDVVMAIPAAHLLHEKGYAIDWICGAAVAPLLACYSWIRPIVADDRAVLRGSWMERMGALGSLWRSLGGVRYDLCVTLYYDRRWQVFSLPVRARRRVALSWTARDRRLVPGRSHGDEFARILMAWPDECRERSIAPVRPDRLPASPLPAVSGAGRVALVPGGASNLLRQQALRRWPVERYATIAATLLERGIEVVLLGGPEDLWVREVFAALAGQAGIFDCLGTLALPEVVSVADSCALVITHDTGPLHLAGLSRAPVLALFGPTDPGSFLPRRLGVQVIWGGEHLACRPCYDGREFPDCPRNACMQAITTEAVMQRVEAMLAGGVFQKAKQSETRETFPMLQGGGR